MRRSNIWWNPCEGPCIYCLREEKISDVIHLESLLYFYPAPEGMYQKNAVRRHWWQDAGLLLQELPASEREAFFLLTGCPVPPCFYKKRPWTQDALSACMAEAVHGARGIADAWLHPEIMTFVSEEFRERWEPKRDTKERLLACLISVFAADCLKESGTAAVLLGKASETLWQMEMTGRLLAPYLPRINSLTFCYEEAGIDLWEEAADCLEDYSYEYGLTPCLVPYGTGAGKMPGPKSFHGGLILDYGASVGGWQFQGEARSVYVDLEGSPSKERKCLAKEGRIRYVSPLKYLDTAVKSGYDRKR